MPPSTRVGALFAALSAVAAGGFAQQGPRFVDRSQGAGLAVVTWSGSVEKPHLLESTGNGVLALDYDRDGYQDLYFVSAFPLPAAPGEAPATGALFRNRGNGTFEEVTERAGVAMRGFGQGGAVGDVDVDGWPDLYVTAFGPNRLFRNNRDGTFTELADAAGVADPAWSVGATFFDADGDGDQDLFVANYVEATWEEVASARRTRMWRGKVAVMDGPRGLTEAANAYYENLGDGRFAEATEAAGLTVGGLGYSLGVASFDYDGDGEVDLFVANDSTPNRLYRNLGGGRFAEVGVESGVAYDGDGALQGSMGAGIGDYDGDGWLDLAVTNFAHDHYTLYRNLAGQLFADESFVSGLAAATYLPLGWAAIFLDADHDADLDLFLTNGHIYPQVDADPSLGESFGQPNQLLVNEGGQFRDLGAEAGSGFAIVKSSRGAAAVDFDNDGDLDLVVSSQDAAPDLLQNVTAGSNHWLAVDLRPAAGAVPALGARVELTTGERRQVRATSSGAGYASENDGRLHFGLAGADAAERLLVVWPDGARIAFLDLPAERIHVVGGRSVEAHAP